MAMGSTRQLVLDLTRAPSYEPENFLVSGSNARAHGLIEAWPNWSGRVLRLVGPAGSGKSHLASMWAGLSGARIVKSGDDLALDDWNEPYIALVEDCDRAGYAEAALFHLLNLVSETSGWLLLTARTDPDRWILKTADLLSRLRLAPAVRVEDPDSDLLRAVLVKLFADRQMRIDEDVVAYAALHCDQTLDAMSRFVAAIDDVSLAAGRRITRPLAIQTIARLNATSPTLDV